MVLAAVNALLKESTSSVAQVSLVLHDWGSFIGDTTITTTLTYRHTLLSWSTFTHHAHRAQAAAS
jgi:hypothetical protein